MPTSVIHEIVGRKIAKKYPNLNNYDFYLGNIAPDSVNYKGFAPKEERWNAHLRDRNLNVWKENIIKFYKSSKSNYNKYFFIGYITHIMTDIVYDESFYDEVVNPMQEINLYGKDAHYYMLKEMNSLGNNNSDYIYVQNILAKFNNLYSIRNITEEILYAWKSQLLDKKLPNLKVKYLSLDIIDNLANKVVDELLKYQIL